MVYLKSLVFNSLFYVGTCVLVIVMGPVLLLPSRFARAVARFWGYMTHLLLAMIGIKQSVHGNRHLDRQVLYAVKHQSAWETVVLALLLHTPVFVLKRELLRLPLLGWYFSKAGCIAVDRSAGMRALRKLRDDAVTAASGGRSILIFPQGTRVAPGVEHRYEIGVFALYEATGLPVVPVALNSGHVWGRNSWLKRPGRIDVEFLAPIEPGLSRRDFMERLETAIETRMAELDAPYLADTAAG